MIRGPVGVLGDLGSLWKAPAVAINPGDLRAHDVAIGALCVLHPVRSCQAIMSTAGVACRYRVKPRESVGWCGVRRFGGGDRFEWRE